MRLLILSGGCTLGILEKNGKNHKKTPLNTSTIMADMDTVDIAEPRDHDSRRSRSQTQQQKSVKTGTWLQAEDVRLRNAVARYGTRWVKVAGEVGSRNGDQCAKRWNENLNPDLDHSPWTPEEVSHLISVN